MGKISSNILYRYSNGESALSATTQKKYEETTNEAPNPTISSSIATATISDTATTTARANFCLSTELSSTSKSQF